MISGSSVVHGRFGRRIQEFRAHSGPGIRLERGRAAAAAILVVAIPRLFGGLAIAETADSPTRGAVNGPSALADLPSGRASPVTATTAFSVLEASAAATSSTATARSCPPAGTSFTAVTAIFDEGRVRLALVPERSPLLLAPILPSVSLEVVPLHDVDTPEEVLRAGQAGALVCGATRSISAAHIRSPVDGSGPFEPFRLPILAVVRGSMSEGSELEERIGRVFDLATVKSPRSHYVPVRAGAKRILPVGSGSVLAVPIESEALGRVAVLYGPIVRFDLGDRGAPLRASQGAPSEAHRSILLSEAARMRLALDDREGALTPGDRVRAAAEGFGAIDRPVELSLGSLPRPGRSRDRFLVAHGLGIGLPLASIGFSLLNASPKCVTYCGGSDLPGDRAFLERFLERSSEDISRHRSALSFAEAGVFGLALFSCVIPSARRGVLSRWEILEDALVIGEGVMVGLTTPLWLQRRIGRARPIRFHPSGAAVERGAGTIGPPLVATRTAMAASATSAAIALLFVEDAGAGWIAGAALGLGALSGAVGYLEARSGLVFPSDVPLGMLNGFLAGTGTVLWHRIFWRGWPGDTSRADLPLRLRGVGAAPVTGGVVLYAGGSF